MLISADTLKWLWKNRKSLFCYDYFWEHSVFSMLWKAIPFFPKLSKFTIRIICNLNFLKPFSWHYRVKPHTFDLEIHVSFFILYWIYWVSAAAVSLLIDFLFMFGRQKWISNITLQSAFLERLTKPKMYFVPHPFFNFGASLAEFVSLVR